MRRSRAGRMVQRYRAAAGPRHAAEEGKMDIPERRAHRESICTGKSDTEVKLVRGESGGIARTHPRDRRPSRCRRHRRGRRRVPAGGCAAAGRVCRRHRARSVAAALAAAQARLGDRAAAVAWVGADIAAWTPAATFDVWHDRAVFHFLTEPQDRHACLARVAQALRVGGHLIIGTFALDGPTRCSGLPVQRYDAAPLQAALGPRFALQATSRTPTSRRRGGGSGSGSAAPPRVIAAPRRRRQPACATPGGWE